jgi:hypothetical protein
MIVLGEPRELLSQEYRPLQYLVSGAQSCEELRAQLNTTRVVSCCDCGCPSIGIESAGPPEPAHLVAERDPVGRDDYFAIRAVGRNAAGGDVDVILHVGAGRVIELEVWAATYGGSPATDLPEITTLRSED